MAPDWDHILSPLLRPGETLLWEGAPLPGLHEPGKAALLMVFGTPFLLAGIGMFFWALHTGASDPGTSDWGLSLFLAAIALVFAGFGGFLTFGPMIEARTTATRMRYALTNRAAYILTQVLTLRVQVYPILPSTPLDLHLGPKGGTVWFHARRERDSDGDQIMERAGFQNIAEAEHVYHLIRGLQEQVT
jgi:hypothetical protein